MTSIILRFRNKIFHYQFIYQVVYVLNHAGSKTTTAHSYIWFKMNTTLKLLLSHYNTQCQACPIWNKCIQINVEYQQDCSACARGHVEQTTHVKKAFLSQIQTDLYLQVMCKYKLYTTNIHNRLTVYVIYTVHSRYTMSQSSNEL